MSETLLVKAPEARRMLGGMSERTLRDLTNKTRELPCVRVGGSLFYDVSDLRAFIESKKIRN